MKPRHRPTLLAVLFAVAAMIVPAGASAASADSWQVVSQLDRSPTYAAVSCPTLHLCWAIEGGRLVRSTDAGTTWHDRTSIVPVDVAQLTDIDCPTATRCYLTARTLSAPEVLVLDAGTIEVSPVPNIQYHLGQISCPTAQRCVALYSGFAVTTDDGGASWAVRNMPTYVPPDAPLSCATRTARCWTSDTAGYLLRSDDAGASWTKIAWPAWQTDRLGVTAMSCLDRMICYLGATSGGHTRMFETTDAGATFVDQTGDVNLFAYAIALSCASTTYCTAVGPVGYGNSALGVLATTDGRHWAQQELPPPIGANGQDVSCASPTGCVAVSNSVAYATANSGTDWAAHALPFGLQSEPAAAMSCGSVSACVVVAPDLLGADRAVISSDGGQSWSEHPLPPTAGDVMDMNCASADTCVAVGTGAGPSPHHLQAIRTSTGGRTWTPGHVEGTGALQEVACPSVRNCLAVGSGANGRRLLRRSVDGGRTWTALRPPGPHLAQLSGLACASTTSCVVFTQQTGANAVPWTTSDLGDSWQKHRLPSPAEPKSISDVACVAATCVAFGTQPPRSPGGTVGVIVSSADGGATWSVIDGAFSTTADNPPAQISCGTTLVCTATVEGSVDSTPHLFRTTDGGTTWQVDYPQDVEISGLPVSCVAQRCLAPEVGNFGQPIVIGD